MTITRLFAGLIAFGLMLGLVLIGQVIQNVDADEIVVIQSPVTGDLTWYTSPGPKYQGFGKVTSYKKRSIYTFQVKMRFNDGAHGNLSGSIQYDLPTDPKLLTEIHTKFGSQAAVETQLIQTVVDKAIYMTGPLMSSKESYAERRNALISYVEDQVANGVFKTKQTENRVKDPVTGEQRTVTQVEIMEVNGVTLRQEEAVLAAFGVKPFNFAITALDYEDQVEKQIQQQQQATMDVNTAIAQSRKAEQDALTAAKQGEANAAKAKWAQETEKAKAVTLAEQEKAVAVTRANQDKEVAVTSASQRRDVAVLDAEAAEQYRIAKIKQAEGDATYKQKVMAADGALAQKLDAIVTINKNYADAIARHQGPWVPSVMMGGNGSGGPSSPAADLISLLTAQTAKQLAFDLTPTVPKER